VSSIPPPPEPSGYDKNPTGVPPPPSRTANPDSYYNSPLYSYFRPYGGFGARGHAFSTGGLGYGPPPLLPSALPMTLFPSWYSGWGARRASSFGPGFGLAVSMSDRYPFLTIKFRPLGRHRDGISLTEAMNWVRLSCSHRYAIRDIVDMCNPLTLKVRVRFFVSIVPVVAFLLMCGFIDGLSVDWISLAYLRDPRE
jgi:hypothetical protein